MAELRFLEPLDVLSHRGNRVFGDPGSLGEAQMPPWPSAMAGAVRSRMLVDAGVDLGDFASGRASGNARLLEVLGTPHSPGAFRIHWFSVARRTGGAIEPLFPLPADVAASEDDDAMRYVHPQKLPAGLRASGGTSQLPTLRPKELRKAEGGLWLTGNGLGRYLRGQALSKKDHVARTGQLWKSDVRVGIALDADTRAAVDGALFMTEAVAPERAVGFLVRVEGADGLVPERGLLRLGGDGRGASVEQCDLALPEPDWGRIEREGRFRIVLATPGLFEQGWLPPGIQPDGASWSGPDGISARLVCAAVSRAQVVSGWDLALRKPKSALRAAPAGSVYWFEARPGDGPALVGGLRKLAQKGFGSVSTYPDRARLAEGFNNVMICNYTDE